MRGGAYYLVEEHPVLIALAALILLISVWLILRRR